MRYPRVHDVFATVHRRATSDGARSFTAEFGLVTRCASKKVMLHESLCSGFELRDSDYGHSGIWCSTGSPEGGRRWSAVWSLDSPLMWRELIGLTEPNIRHGEQWPFPVPPIEILKNNPLFYFNGTQRAQLWVWKIEVFNQGEDRSLAIVVHFVPLERGIRCRQVRMLVAEFNGLDDSMWLAKERLDGDVVVAGRLVPGRM